LIWRRIAAARRHPILRHTSSFLTASPARRREANCRRAGTGRATRMRRWEQRPGPLHRPAGRCAAVWAVQRQGAIPRARSLVVRSAGHCAYRFRRRIFASAPRRAALTAAAELARPRPIARLENPNLVHTRIRRSSDVKALHTDLLPRSPASTAPVCPLPAWTGTPPRDGEPASVGAGDRTSAFFFRRGGITSAAARQLQVDEHCLGR
jgi:hypothetical protein